MKVTADFYRHLFAGIAGAILTALVAYLAKVDWSSFGPYASFIQLFVQVATEIVNQYFGHAAVPLASDVPNVTKAG